MDWSVSIVFLFVSNEVPFFVQKNNKRQKMCFLEQSENRTQEREKKGTQSSHLSDTDQSRLGAKSEAEAGDAKKKKR